MGMSGVVKMIPLKMTCFGDTAWNENIEGGRLLINVVRFGLLFLLYFAGLGWFMYNRIHTSRGK